MTGKYLLDALDESGLLSEATDHLGLRGHVLDTKCSPRYDVTQLLVPTRIRQDVSAGICVGGMVSRLCDNTLRALPKLFPPVRPSHKCFTVFACFGFWNTRVIHGFETRQKSRVLRPAQPRTPRALADFCVFLDLKAAKRTLFLVGNLHRIARKCVGTGGRCSVSGQKFVVTTPGLTVYLSH